MLTGFIGERLKIFGSQGFLKYGPYWHPELYIQKLIEGGFVNITMETVTKASGHSYQVIFASKALEDEEDKLP